MIEKIKKDKLTEMLEKLKIIYAVKFEIKALADAGLLKAVKGMYYGSEAASAGICAALKDSDRIVNSFDGVGTLIARGCSVKNIMAEMLGKSGGYNNGVRGFYNITVPEKGIYSANSFSDTQVAMGTGFALASKIKGDDETVAAFYNGYNANEGIIHESMNIAAAFGLPVLFICITSIGKNDINGAHSIDNGQFFSRSIGYNIGGHAVDGMDVVSVYTLAEELAEQIRVSKKPAVMECLIDCAYEEFNPAENKTAQQNCEMVKKSIISRTVDDFESKLIKTNAINAAQAKNLDEKCKNIAAEAVKFAKDSLAPKEDFLNNIMYATSNTGI